MKIYLQRHGLTDWNKEGRIQGHTDIALNETGIRQIEAVGDYFVAIHETIDVILTSPLQRAKKTAEIIAHKIGYNPQDIIIDPIFIERSFGNGEGMIYEDVLKKYPDGKNLTAEPLPDLLTRAANAIQKSVDTYPNQTILIATHGATLKAILSTISNGQITYEDSTFIPAAGLSLLEYENGEFRIVFTGKSL